MSFDVVPLFDAADAFGELVVQAVRARARTR